MPTAKSPLYVTSNDRAHSFKSKHHILKQCASLSACFACKRKLLPPDAVVGQQHSRVVAHPQRRVGFGEDCTRKSHSQLHAVEDSTVICDSKWEENKQSRDLAGGNHHWLTSETGSSSGKLDPPRLLVVPKSSHI